MNIIGLCAYNKSKRDLIGNDNDLIEKIKNGDKRAFDLLVDRHKKRAYFTALGLLGESELAYDISQDAWIAAYNAMDRFELGKPFYPWFHTILRNLCKNALRHRDVVNRVVPTHMEDNPEKQYEGSVLAPESLVEQREIKEYLWKAIECLPLEHREIVILLHFQNLSYAEISETLKIPIGTVMSRLYYARKKLAGLLEGVLDD